MSLCRLCTVACSPRPFAPSHYQPTLCTHAHTPLAHTHTQHAFRLHAHISHRVVILSRTRARKIYMVCASKVYDRTPLPLSPPSFKRWANAMRAREQFCTDQFDCMKCVDSFAATATTATNDTKINLSPSRDETMAE